MTIPCPILGLYSRLSEASNTSLFFCVWLILKLEWPKIVLHSSGWACI